MLHDLLPYGVVGAARALGVEPMDVIRLAVMTGNMPETLSFTPALVEALREAGSIESGWWAGATLPTDPNPARARIRGAVALLLERAANGPVRMDNLWRDLSFEEQELLQDAFDVLADDELVEIVADARGVWIAVANGQRDDLARIADGTQESAGLTQLLQG